MKSIRVVLPLLCFALVIAGDSAKAPSPWRVVDSGLSIGEFLPALPGYTGTTKIIIVKIDPHKYQLKLLTAAEYKHESLRAPEWCEKYGLVAAINAGMFLPDYKTNVGYMKNFQSVNNPRIHRTYLSVAAFNPRKQSKPPFKIYDADVTKVEDIQKAYHSVVQNLRLIQRPGKNKWSQQTKKWSEAALGQDKDGNILFIFSRAPFTMYDFNEILLALPIKLVCAQHLEGGPEASLFLSHKNTKLELVGSFESAFNETYTHTTFLPIPNVLGIVKKK